MSSISKYARTPSARTHTFKRRKQLTGDVPIFQLYRDIDAGYQYFLANRTRSGALESKRSDIASKS